MLERDVEQYLVTQCKSRDWLCWKMQSSSLRGFPDRMVVTRTGKIYFVEVKAEKGIVSPLQRAVHDKLTSRGVTVYVAVGSAGVDKLLAIAELIG